MKVSPPGSDEETEVATSNGAIPTHWTALPLLPHSHTCLYTTYDSCFNFLFLLEVQNMSPGVLFIAESFVYIMLSLQCKMCTCSLAQNLLVWCVYGCAVLCSCPVWTGEWSDCAWNAALQGMLIGYLNQYKGVCVCIYICVCIYVCDILFRVNHMPRPPNYYIRLPKWWYWVYTMIEVAVKSWAAESVHYAGMEQRQN